MKNERIEEKNSKIVYFYIWNNKQISFVIGIKMIQQRV